jgi:DNA-binding HxlR family transcriptional regulator
LAARPLKREKLGGKTAIKPFATKTQPVLTCNQLYNHREKAMHNESGGRVRKDHRSECVMNRTVETFGDQWSLLVIRDMMFMNRRHFRELLTESPERIASNILANRLQMLVKQGIIVKSHDPSHKQKAIYSLTEKGIELLPLLMEMSAWGLKHLPDAGLKGLARIVEEGGPKLRAQFMTELRETHLRKSSAKKRARSRTKSTHSAMRKLQAAYEAELAGRRQ